MLGALPVELLDHIFAHVVWGRDLINIACVCKLFHAVVEPHIYRSLVACNDHQLRSINLALTAKPTRAKDVLKLTYIRRPNFPTMGTFPMSEFARPMDPLQEFQDNILPKLTRLKELDLMITTYLDCPGWSLAFKRATWGEVLQSLQSCSLKFPVDGGGRMHISKLSAILAHPKLKNLYIDAADCTMSSLGFLLPENNASTALRKLELVYCRMVPGDLKCILSRTRGLKELVIWLDEKASEITNFHDYAEDLQEVATTLEWLAIDTTGTLSGSPLCLDQMIALRDVAVDASIWFGLLCSYPENTSERFLRSVFPPCLETMMIGGWTVTDSMLENPPADPLLEVLQPMFDNFEAVAPALRHISFGSEPLPKVSAAFMEACAKRGISVDL